MRLFDSNLEASGLTFEELEDCSGCQPTHWQLSDTSGFNLCSYHEGFVAGFEEGERRAAPLREVAEPTRKQQFDECVNTVKSATVRPWEWRTINTK